MKRTTLLKHLSLSILLLATLEACNQGSQASGGKPSPVVKVKLTALETGTINDSSEFLANLQSRRSVTLQPQVEGQVAQIVVQPGDYVSAGTALLQLNPAEQQASVSSSSAAVASAEAERENAAAVIKTYEAERQSKLADLKFNQQQYDRFAALARQGAVSQQDLDRYVNALAAARASLNAVNAQIEAQQAAIAKADRVVQQAEAQTREQQVQLQYYKITAPFAGTVGDIPVKVGDFVDKNTKLITVTENNPLEVNLSIPVDRAADIKVGTQIQLLNSQGQATGKSRVFFIAPNVNNETQSVLVKALFDNASGQLRANQFVRARVIWENRPGILIPTTAVSRIAGQNFVYVAESDGQSKQLIARQKPVKLGSIQGNSYQVLSGLKPGETIVVSGLLNLANNTPIVPES